MAKFPQEFVDFVNENPKLVSRRESIRYPGLFVLKYSRKVFYDALWNDYLEECRGTVVDKDWNVVILPFRKIYNRGENGMDFPLDLKVEKVEKINGFMAAATYVEGHGVVVSTTGSLDSDFVSMAEKWLMPSIIPWIEERGHGFTWLFEICDPSDPHIIKELPGVYLIGARLIEYGGMSSEDDLDYVALRMGVKRPNHIKLSFKTVLEHAKNYQREGYVVRGDNGQSLKIKSPYYLLTKFIARANNSKFEDIMNGNFDKTIDEEFYPLLAHLRKHRGNVMNMTEQDRIKYIGDFFGK